MFTEIVDGQNAGQGDRSFRWDKKEVICVKFIQARTGGRKFFMIESYIHTCKLWEIVKDRETWCAAVRGITKGRIQHSNWTCVHVNMCSWQSCVNICKCWLAYSDRLYTVPEGRAQERYDGKCGNLSWFVLG